MKRSHKRPSRYTPPANHAAVLALILLAALSLASPAVSAEELWSDAGFFIDLPEGFKLTDGDGKTRFSFQDPLGGMSLDILSYEPARYKGAEAMAEDLLKKLGSQGERETFVYEGRTCVFAELGFALNGEKKQGYAIFVGGRRQDPPGAKPERSVALLAYTSPKDFESYSDFILSSLDAFSVDRAALRSPGPLSQYILPFPAERKERKTVVFGAERLELPWSADESSQATDTAGREFRVLEAYAGVAELWKEAWARCYRMIYRESARRLDLLAMEVDRLLPDNDTDAVRTMLQWVQGFKYERDPQGIDFVEPMAAAYEGRGDCDSRAMVMAIILERRGIDSILMLSRDYSHAMAAFDVEGGGQRFPWAGKQWLVAETTAKVGLGLIAKNQADWKKWLGVEFGE